MNNCFFKNGTNKKGAQQNNFVEVEPKNFDYIKNMYPSTMLDEERKIGTLEHISPLQEENAQNGGGNHYNEPNFDNKQNSQKSEPTTPIQNNDMTNLISTLSQNVTQNNPLASLLPLLLQGNLGGGNNADVLNLVTKLPQFQGQIGANLINMLSNFTKNSSEKTVKNFEEYKVIKELD